MKSLIVYDTRHGTSKEVAERIAAAIREKGAEAELLDLRARGAKAAPLGAYDEVVIGAPFYMVQWSKRAAAFAKAREAELATKRLGLFAVGSNAELGVEAAKSALPAALAAKIADAAYVGGRVEYQRLGAFERFIVKLVSGAAESSSTLDLGAAEALGAAIGASLAAKGGSDEKR
jgi:menaquinone-dependent protoporphyrinogen oxidase